MFERLKEWGVMALVVVVIGGLILASLMYEFAKFRFFWTNG